VRNALNNNPVVQAVVIGVMALLVVFLLYTRVINRDDEEAPPPEDAAATEAGAGTPATPAPAAPSSGDAATAPEAAGVPSDGSAPAPAPTASPSDVQANFIPGPGLPEEIVVAYAQNKAVVLLVVNEKGIDDAAVQASVASLSGRSDVELILVPTKDVADYARVTEGVDLNRTPAIVVIRPRKLTGNVPEATISYGFRGPESVQQAVEDAMFDGKPATYDP
jgi:hypothetical protein